MVPAVAFYEECIAGEMQKRMEAEDALEVVHKQLEEKEQAEDVEQQAKRARCDLPKSRGGWAERAN